MIKEATHDAERRMKSAIQSLKDDLVGIRTGRANPGLVEKLSVEYYGSPVPLIQLATISVPEPRQLLIKPFDAGSIKDIERAIQSSDLGLTPLSDGKVIRLNLPALTEERRQELAKLVRQRVEEGKVTLRNIRRDAMNDLREFEKEKLIPEDDFYRGKDDLQDLIDRYSDQMDEINSRKQREILEG